MNILVLSGGSGNDALVKGIKKVYPESAVRVLVNAYDNGKSTGVCRQVTNTLGVSDIRKNHSRMYLATNPAPNACYVEFYEGRYDLTKGRELEEVLAKLQDWNLQDLSYYAELFFQHEAVQDYEFKDFSISNIIYSAMYEQHGYEETNRYFTNLLGIDDFVILNSFDNVFINAVTRGGKLIDDEGAIVEYANADDPICDITYTNIPETGATLNPVAIESIATADMIVISTGTFWASIYPTLQYQDLYRYINQATCKKVWAINNEEDKDAYGVTSNDMIDHFDRLGLDVKDFTILLNADAKELLRQENSEYNIVTIPMENNNGKHNGEKYAKAILRIYFDIVDPTRFEKFVFDFDDTLWARSANDSRTEFMLTNCSRQNVELLNKLGSKGVIISGNSYSSIAKKLATVYGSALKNFNIDLWADANAFLYRGCTKVRSIDRLLLKNDISKFINTLRDAYDINCSTNEGSKISYIKIKPLSKLDQKLLADYLNNYLLDVCGLPDAVAVPTGTSTVDIISTANNKSVVLEHLDVDRNAILYVGDEIDSGNDKEIARSCGASIHTSNVFETNALLKLLTEVV